MSFTDAIKTCFNKYVDFSGRARRSEYWYFALFNSIVSIVLTIIFSENSAIISIWSLAVLLPGLAVCVRRMHDVGKSGWSILLALIPIVGWIIVIVRVCQDSMPGDNQYGPNPKEASSVSDSSAYESYSPVADEPAYSAPAAEKPSYDYGEDPFSKDNVAKYNQPKKMPKFCIYCGSPIEAGNKFCPSCGASIEQMQ